MAKRPRIGVVGSSNVDLVTYVDRMPVWGETIAAPRFEMSHGGKGANQAVAAAKLGAAVVMVSKVGDDMLGDGVLQNFERTGVDARHVERVAGQSTGTATILVDKSGDNCILIVKGANGDLDAGGRRARRRRSQDLRSHPHPARGAARDRLRDARLRQAARREDRAQPGARGPRSRHGASARRELPHAERDRARHPHRAAGRVGSRSRRRGAQPRRDRGSRRSSSPSAPAARSSRRRRARGGSRRSRSRRSTPPAPATPSSAASPATSPPAFPSTPRSPRRPATPPSR